jgi:hypothetical protein
MNKLLRNLLLGATLGVSLLAVAPQSAKADSYWTNHWGWYDNTYRPYYQRRYYYNTYPPPAYYGPSYSGGYYTAPYSTPYNGPYYGGPYYGSGVRVGPLQFGWW